MPDIYLYYENKRNQFLTTTEGLIADDDYFDMKWRNEYLENKNKRDKWISYRRIYPDGYNKPATDVTTLYRVLKTGDVVDGVLVLNIYTEYIEHMLKRINTLPEQYILVLDENNNILFSNKELSYLAELDMLYTLSIDKEDTIKARLGSQLYNWDYYSVVIITDYETYYNKKT